MYGFDFVLSARFAAEPAPIMSICMCMFYIDGANMHENKSPGKDANADDVQGCTTNYLTLDKK